MKNILDNNIINNLKKYFLFCILILSLTANVAGEEWIYATPDNLEFLEMTDAQLYEIINSPDFKGIKSQDDDGNIIEVTDREDILDFVNQTSDFRTAYQNKDLAGLLDVAEQQGLNTSELTEQLKENATEKLSAAWNQLDKKQLAKTIVASDGFKLAVFFMLLPWIWKILKAILFPKKVSK